MTLTRDAVGQAQPQVSWHDGSCTTTAQAILCDLDDGGSGSASLNMNWTSVDNVTSFGSRPSCLPPSESGREHEVQLGVVSISDDELPLYRHIVWVRC